MLYYISQRDLYAICIMQTKNIIHYIPWYDIISDGVNWDTMKYGNALCHGIKYKQIISHSSPS